MTQKIFNEVKNILLDNSVRFSTIAESTGQFDKMSDDKYMGCIYFSVQHYCEFVRFTFDGSDEDFINSIIKAFDKYTDLSKYSFVIDGVPMTFSKKIIEECRNVSLNIIDSLCDVMNIA